MQQKKNTSLTSLRFLSKPALGILGVATLAGIPIGAVLLALFMSDGEMVVSLWRTTLPIYAYNSVALMLMVAALTVVMGVGTAWLVTATIFPGSRVFASLLVLPLAAPAYIVAYLYTDALSFSGPVQTRLRDWLSLSSSDYWFPQIRSLPGAALMLALVLYPYVYLLTRAAFAAQSHSQLSAARSLGLSPWGAFFRVALPAARPAIIGGVALVMMETLADFGVADYFAISTFSTGIFRVWLATGAILPAMQLAATMLVFVIVLVMIESLSRRGSVSGVEKTSCNPFFVLSPGACVFAVAACGLPVLLGFILPVWMLLYNALTIGDKQGWYVLLGYAGNSLVIASIVALLATALALFLSYARRHTRFVGAGQGLVNGSIGLATLGYALPGAVLAVGLLGPLGQLDQALIHFCRTIFNRDYGLILTGSLVILVYALVVRFLTVSYNSIESGMQKIPPTMEAVARSLGIGALGTVRHIHIPLLRQSLVIAGALVFIDVMRELPATVILRPFNFETLATRVYRLASDERIGEASTAALIIVLLGIIPVISLARMRK